MLSLSRLFALMLALVVSLPFASSPTTPATPSAQPSAIIIGLHPDIPALPGGVLPLSAARSVATVGIDPLPVAPGAAPLYRLRLAPGADLQTAVALLRSDPAVAFAEPDQLAVAIAAPNDPGYAQQWGLTKIDAEAAWAVTTGNPETVVAVIDSGIDLDHPDLAARLWRNPGEIPGNGKDDDNNGFVDDLHGWNFLATNADLSDTNGHGTQVAGVIAATTNNGQGVAGLCGGCSLMVLKVLRADGTANYSDIAAAIGYAAQKGADVINLSLGGTSDSAALRAAVAAAAPTAVIVAGAGNNNSNAPFYPAAYDEHVLAVTATGPSDTKVASANYGAWVDVAAPGEQIYTTYDGGDYGDSSGTSLGAPFASGLAGLLVSARPSWSPADVRAQIIRTASNIDTANPGFAGQLGRGRIAADAALTTTPTPQLQVASIVVNGQPGGRPEPGTEAQVLVTLANGWATLTSAQGTLGGGGVTQGSATFGTVPALGSATASQAFRVNVPANAGYNKALAFTLRVTGAGGFSADLPVTITTAPGITDAPATINTQTWTADRVYRVNGEVGIPSGQTLTIQPGTVVRFAENAKLRVQGTLIADGTAERPIIFTSQDPSKDWAGIVFEDSSVDASLDDAWAYQSGSILRHAVVENSSVKLNQAAPYIANSSFQFSDQLYYDSSMIYTYGLIGDPTGRLVVSENTFHGLPVSLHFMYGGSAGRFTDNTVLNSAVSFGSSADTPLTISGNRITSRSQNAMGSALNASGALTVTGNFVQGGPLSLQNSSVMTVTSVVARGNLVSGSSGAGIHAQLIGLTTPDASFIIEDNTLIDNAEAGIAVNAYATGGSGPMPLTIRRNNLIPAEGSFALRLSDDFTFPVNAQENYWGTSDPAAIAQRIYDGNDKFGLGIVNFQPFLTAPVAIAPAFVERVTVSPDTTLGIQTGTFDVRFSRPMDTSTTPALRFYDARRGSFEQYSLPEGVMDGPIALDSKGLMWLAGYGKLFSYDGQKWQPHEVSLDSNMPTPTPSGLAIGPDDVKWMSTWDGLLSFDGQQWGYYQVPPCSPTGPCMAMNYAIVAASPNGDIWIAGNNPTPTGSEIGFGRFADGKWTLYRAGSNGIPKGPGISQIAVDPQGVLWASLSTNNANTPNLLRFDGQTWSSFKVAPSQDIGLWTVSGIAFDLDGSIWVRIASTLAHLEGDTWQYYTAPMEMYGIFSGGLAIDKNGTKWLGNNMLLALVSFDGSTWRTYQASANGNFGSQLIVDQEGHKWSTGNLFTPTIVVFRDGYDTTVPTGTWLDERTYRASVEITSLVDRGQKRLEVTGAADSSGMPVADNSHTTFTVDYAGQVSDRTPPLTPYVFASGLSGDATKVAIQYAVNDAESAVDRVRYAIGSSPESGDIVSWTELEEGARAQTLASLAAVSELQRSGLGLTAGRTYYVSFQARNTGGLWSPIAVSAFIAGQVTNPRPYISALGPSQGRVGASDLELTIHGYGFMPESVVLWNGKPRETTYVSASELRATIPANDLAAAGKAAISVRNPEPGGGDSDPATFPISDSWVGSLYQISLPLVRR